jgi:hypothetical protein
MEDNKTKSPPFPVWQNSCCRHEPVVTSLPMGMKSGLALAENVKLYRKAK